MAALILAVFLAGHASRGDESSGGADAAPATERDGGEWREASRARELEFPRDHGAHEDYRIEWWYWTGNLDGAEGEELGYQLTFFRIGVDREPEIPSRWAVRDLHMAHVAVSDVSGERFHHAGRLRRRGVGWAGFEGDDDGEGAPFRVWSEDWSAEIEGDRHLLSAETEAFALELELEASGPPVLHGEAGFSRKGASEGNASHYYSYPRMRTTGRVRIGARELTVAGESWMDHEFGTTFLEREQTGWDWFSIRLDDGRSLMLFQLRRGDGGVDPWSSGTLIGADRSARVLEAGEFRLVPARRWTSPRSGGKYPVEWNVQVPGEELRLTVRAAFEGQEITDAGGGVRYWEGAVRVSGTSRGEEIRGRGYLEMTGYAGPAMGESFDPRR